jgi:DNA polymerase III epsilon subunit-like protein
VSVVFFDTETGGLTPAHPTIQLAAIAVDSEWNELETFERKISFDVAKADPEALKLNHYDARAWQDAFSEKVVVGLFAAFLKRHASVELVSRRTGNPYSVARLAGHNVVGFDLEWLAAAFKRHGQFFAADFRSVCDTRHGAVWFFEAHPELERPADFKLVTLATYFGIPTDGAHDALFDVRLSIALARRIVAPEQWRPQASAVA